MPPIPVYSASPISAAKADGVTPKTAQEDSSSPQQQQAATASNPAGSRGYPPAAPAAAPSLPKPTGALQAPFRSSIRPTPTSAISGSDGPPPPQPGAVPVPPGGYSVKQAVPPPPKAGESLENMQTGPTTMPPQMGYLPPEPSQPIQGRWSTTTTQPPPPMAGNYFQQGGGAGGGLHGAGAGYSPPAGGYQQNVHAAGYSGYQGRSDYDDHSGDPGVWDAAKKWASSAGESLAAAEHEVWKRINKE